MSSTFELQIEIEKRCLLNCRHCSSPSLRHLGQIGFDVSHVTDFMQLLGEPVYVYLTGGEPLLNPTICDAITKLKSLSSKNMISIFTAGIVQSKDEISSLSLDSARMLRTAGLDSCYMSIYSHKPWLHESITNLNGSFYHTEFSIKNLCAVGVEVNGHLVLNKYNIDHIDEIIDYSQKMGLKELRILKLVKAGNALHNWTHIGVHEEQQNEILERIISNIRRYDIHLTISGFPEKVHCRPFHTSVKCQAGSRLFYIDFLGDVYPCACTKGIQRFKISNVRDTNLIRAYLKENMYMINDSCLNSIEYAFKSHSI